MSYPINYPTPQGANVQVFNNPAGNSTAYYLNWTKPQGASFVWFTLIGGGGGGDNSSTGGGSGAVTNCMVPAFLIPDNLSIWVGTGGNPTGSGGTSYVAYTDKIGAKDGYTLLTANGGAAGGAGGAAMTANYFTAMGFFQSIGGQDGPVGSLISASPTTFLSSGGITGGANPERANYGYTTSNTTASPGFFMLQPIIVGIGGVDDKKGGIGCGGGATGKGGDGLVVIITW
jgi:hypothetical protein